MVFDLHTLMRPPERPVPPDVHKEYTLHYAKVMEEKFNYRRFKENAGAFDAIASFIAHWRAAKENLCSYPARGLFLFGGPGTGKSTAMQLFSGLCGIEIISSGELSKIFGLNSYEGFWKTADEFRNSALIIDDLGCESDAKSFGNTLPMTDFIRSRESLWRSSGICTCFTSNANNREDIIKKYGNSICSRLLGMCEFIHVKGPDHRISRASGK